VIRPLSPGIRAGHQSFVDTHGASGVSPPCLDLLHLFSLRAAFPTLCAVSAGMEDATGPSSQRFECGDDNVFGHQFRRLKIREEQACSHCI